MVELLGPPLLAATYRGPSAEQHISAGRLLWRGLVRGVLPSTGCGNLRRSTSRNGVPPLPSFAPSRVRGCCNPASGKPNRVDQHAANWNAAGAGALPRWAEPTCRRLVSPGLTGWAGWADWALDQHREL